MKYKRQQEEGKQKEKFEYFHLQNDEFDPYAIVVLNQLWKYEDMSGLKKGKKKIKKINEEKMK